MNNNQIFKEWLMSKKHILVTGTRNTGKTTLLDSFDQQEGPFDGIRTYKEDDKVYLADRRDPENRMIIGKKSVNRMVPVPTGFHLLGIKLLNKCMNSNQEIILIDEVGFLEATSPSYVNKIIELAHQKRLILVMREQDSVLQTRLGELGPIEEYRLREVYETTHS